MGSGRGGSGSLWPEVLVPCSHVDGYTPKSLKSQICPSASTVRVGEELRKRLSFTRENGSQSPLVQRAQELIKTSWCGPATACRPLGQEAKQGEQGNEDRL